MGTWQQRKITRVWAIINPNGDLLADSTFVDESQAWQIALGWPGPEEIEQAKRDGWVAQQIAVIA